MAHSPELDALFVDLSLCAHAPRAETRSLAHADREDVAQDTLLVLWRRRSACGGAEAVAALEPMLGGVLRNVGRNEKRCRGVREGRRCGKENSLSVIAAPEEAVTDDWRETLTAEECSWVAGFESMNDVVLAKVRGVHPTTVSWWRRTLERRVSEIMRADA